MVSKILMIREVASGKYKCRFLVWIVISPGSLPKCGILPASIKNKPAKIIIIPKNISILPISEIESILSSGKNKIKLKA